MDEALEQISKQSIRPTSPRVRRVPCVCAVCGFAVFYAGGPGTLQIAHFRHRQNTKAKKVCPLYHAGAGVSVREFLGERISRLRELRLCIVLRSGKGRTKWELMLHVPRFEHAESVTVGIYSPNAAQYPVDEIPVEGRAFAVFPQRDDYEVEVSEAGRADMLESIEGLKEPSIFAVGHALSRRLVSGEELAWGRTYAFLQRNKIETNKMPAELQTRLLADNDGWHGCVLGLPANANDRVAQWIKVHLRRSIAIQPLTMTVLSPVSARLGNDDTWRVVPGQGPVTVGLRFAEVPKAPTMLRFVAGASKTEYVVQEQSPTVLIDLGELPPGLSELRVISTEGSKITFDVGMPNSEDIEMPRPRVAFMFEKSKMVDTVSLWAESLPRMFEGVRRKAFVLDGVLLPEDGQLSIVEVRGNNRLEEVHEFSQEAALKILSRLNELLSNPLAKFEIQAEGFGRVLFPKPVIAGEAETSTAGSQASRTKRQDARSAWLRLAIGAGAAIGHPRFFPRSDPRHRFNAHLNQVSR